MLAKILFNLMYLSIEGRGTIHTDDFHITNDQSIRKDFFTDDFKKLLGLVATQYEEKSAFAYCEFDIDIEGKSLVDISNDLSNELRDRLGKLKSLLSLLWLVKDNSVCVINGIAVIPEMKYIVQTTDNGRPTNCQALHAYTTFSKSELEYASAIAKKYSESCPNSSPILEDNVDWQLNDQGNPIFGLGAHSKEFDYSKYNCIQRSMVFLATARGCGYLVYKISYYMPIFECLFTSDRSEVTQKVCERAAFYLEESREDRIAIFDKIKDAYDIRSTFLHGQQFKAKDIKYDNLLEISIKIDEILRAAMLCVIMVDSNNFIDKTTFLDAKGRSGYLKSLIFQ